MGGHRAYQDITDLHLRSKLRLGLYDKIFYRFTWLKNIVKINVILEINNAMYMYSLYYTISYYYIDSIYLSIGLDWKALV